MMPGANITTLDGDITIGMNSDPAIYGGPEGTSLNLHSCSLAAGGDLIL